MRYIVTATLAFIFWPVTLAIVAVLLAGVLTDSDINSRTDDMP